MRVGHQGIREAGSQPETWRKEVEARAASELSDGSAA